MSGGEWGKGRGRERPICLVADNPSCSPKAEVKKTPPEFFLPNSFICCYIYIYIYIKKGKLYFNITPELG